jgi:4-hydroxy-2-oxovalerate aldolase
VQPTLIDCTLRDGSNAVDFNFDETTVRRILRGLEQGGVRWIDLGHGLGPGAREKSGKPGVLTEEQYLTIAGEELSHASYGMFFLAKFGEMKHIDMIARGGCRFIRIGANITEVEEIEPFVRYARELGLYVNVCLMKAYAVSLSEYIAILEEVDSWELDLITLMDSAGTMMPGEVKERIIRGRLHLQNAGIGFHAHNNLQMAVSNVVIAVESGADSFDASVGGLGRSSGNAPTEIAALVLQRHGYDLGLDYKILSDLNDQVVYPLISGENRFSTEALTFGYAGFHSGFHPLVLEAMKNVSGIDPRDLIVELCRKERVSVDRKLVDDTLNEIASRQ